MIRIITDQQVISCESLEPQTNIRYCARCCVLRNKGQVAIYLNFKIDKHSKEIRIYFLGLT